MLGVSVLVVLLASRRRLVGSIALVLAAMLAAACSMVRTSILDTDPNAPLGCRTQVGAYFLSKSFLKVAVVEAVDEHGASLDLPFYLIKTGVGVEPRPDAAFPLCLDYRASITSNDTLIVEKKDQLLAKITSSADDKSADIAKNLISALFIGASQNPDFSQTLRSGNITNSYAPRFEAEFDPFDEVETAKVNSGLRDFGFCLLLKYQGARIDPTRHDVQRYCDAPLHFVSDGKLKWYGVAPLEEEAGAPDAEVVEPVGNWHQRRDHPQPYADGIFYRPRLPYAAFLFVKKNPRAKQGWLLRGSETAQLENRSPVIRVAVDRTFFAKRETTLSFDKGVLRDITIRKDSEMAGFVTIPLQIAQSVAALPANVIQVKIQQTNNLNELMDAQARLIEANNQATGLQRQIDEARAATRSGGLRSSQGTSARASTDAGMRTGEASTWNASVSRDTTGRATSTSGFPGCLQQCLQGGREAYCSKFCSCMSSCQDGTEAACRAACTRQIP